MTQATWERINRLSVVSAETDNPEKADRIEVCIDRLLDRAGIDPYQHPEWELIEFEYTAGKIVVYKGCFEVLQEISVLKH